MEKEEIMVYTRINGTLVRMPKSLLNNYKTGQNNFKLSKTGMFKKEDIQTKK